MSKSARTIFIYGLYALFAGIGFILMPDFCLGLFVARQNLLFRSF